MRHCLYIGMLLLLLSACARHHSGRTDMALIDSLTSVVYSMMDDQPEQAMALVDSLEREGIYSSVMANCRRAQIASEQYEPSKSEAYALRALNDKRLKDEKTEITYFIYNLLINSASNVGNTEQALKYATEAVRIAHSDSSRASKLYLPDFLTSIGSCQFKLNRNHEGNENYERAWLGNEELLKNAKSFTWFYPAFMLAVSAINDNAATDSLDVAMRWLPRLQNIYQRTITAEDIPDHVKDNCTAEMEMTLARLYVLLGQRREAEQHYKAFLATNFAKCSAGQKYSASYLEKTGRWAELAQCVDLSEAYYVENHSQYTHEYLNTVLARKFKAQMQLHQHEAALNTAASLIAMLDTVQELENRDDAAKLAVVYETQEKEQKIAQQEADLTKQRLIAIIVAFALTVVFLVMYVVFRRQAARRLALVSAQKERIESELRIAREIQMSMVPNDFPQLDGLDLYAQMTPAREVGGDLYDYIIQDGYLFFCVGDVSGKGVPSSLFMAQTLRLFRAFAKRRYAPAEIATRINDELTDHNENGMFVTMFIGKINLRTGSLEFCNCGHNPPLLSGQVMEVKSNVPIGLWENFVFEGEERENVKGCRLFVYTDGLNEAENPFQEQFGEDRLTSALRSHPEGTSRQLIEYLFAQVALFRQGAEPNDDLTMLCLNIL